MEAKIERSEEILSDSEEEFLQPISRFYPPNQIVDKNYSPDQKPILKLIKPEKPQVLTCQQLKDSYSMLFNEDDTLGYHYSYSLAHSIVYLKLNNKNYMKYTNKYATHRFLAGMFLPPDKMITPEFRAHKNIYKSLPDTEYMQYRPNIPQSFSSNCKSNGLDLRFSSNYQSGNLFIAMKKKNFEYDLILQNDINSKGNTQWFNFVVDFRVEGRYRFTILNFTKSYSQFENGLKITCFKFVDQENGRAKWFRGGQKIKYQESYIQREDCSHKNYYSLKFEYQCSVPGKIMFCYFYPYTSLDLQKFLKKTFYRKLNVHMKLEKIKICETISGLPVLAIHIFHKKLQKNNQINNSPVSVTRNGQNNPKQRRSIVFMARQHPGQTQGSFFIEGVIDFLMENGEMDYLKKNFDFYIFPMVNVDGVYYGNYRTNLSGTDLNRIWRNPRKDLHPQVYYIKKFLLNLNYNSPISLILDVHGHSKSLNSFFYGNPPKKDILSGQIEETKLFPFVCSKKIKQISFLQSTFSISEDKKNSARVVLSEYFPKALVYTLENSFHGWKKQNGHVHDYTPEILKKMARQLIITYLQYEKLIEKNPNIKEKWEKEIQELKNKQTSERKSSEKIDVGESDSEAEEQLIDLCQDFNELREEQSIFQKNSQSSSHFSSILQNKTNVERVREQRKLQIVSQKKYTKYHRNIPSLENSVGKLNIKKTQKSPSINSGNYGFLSIVKIKTTNRQDIYSKKERQKQNQAQKIIHERDREARYLGGSQKFLGCKFTKQNILEKLKRQNIKISEAVNSSSGMKTFLHAMGIPIDRKYP